MRARDVVSYSFSAIKLRKLRAGLTTLGVVIGIAAIVALLSITQGLQSTITKQLETGFAADTLIVTTGGGGFGFGNGRGNAGSTGSGFALSVNDTQRINNITHVETSIAIIQRIGWIKSGSNLSLVSILGIDFSEYLDIYGSTFVPQAGIISADPSNTTIVVGNRIADPQNNGTMVFRVNDPAYIVWTNATTLPPRNETYSGNITAVLKQIGGFGVGGPSDSGVYIPLSKAESFFGTNKCDMIIVKLDSTDESIIKTVSDSIKTSFSSEVSVTSATAVLSLISNVFSLIQLFLGGIAAISLLVAGIGIMNIMIVSLMERTREIGILKALGMRSSTVLLVFLCESALIGLIGAFIGIGTGWVLANVVSIFIGRGGLFTGNQTATSGNISITPLLTPSVFLGALAFGLGVSVIFALYPAWRASKLKPVEALRYE